MFPGSTRDRHRLPRTDLGTGHVSLPHAAAAGGVNFCSVAPRATLSAVRDRRYSLVCDRRWLISAFQDCVVQIGWMRFARIERDDYAFVRKIDFYVFHPRNVLQARSQFPHALIAIFTFRGDLDRFQNSVVEPFRSKWIGRIGISRSCMVHLVSFSYLTRHFRTMVASTRFPINTKL